MNILIGCWLTHVETIGLSDFSYNHLTVLSSPHSAISDDPPLRTVLRKKLASLFVPTTKESYHVVTINSVKLLLQRYQLEGIFGALHMTQGALPFRPFDFPEQPL